MIDGPLFGKDKKCVRCGGTKICFTCKGEGRIIPKGKTIMSLMICPTCKGKKICTFCEETEAEKAIAK